MPVPGPVDLAGSLDVYRRSGDDLLDRWDGRVWLRAVAVGGAMVGTSARPAGTVTDPVLVVEAEATVGSAEQDNFWYPNRLVQDWISGAQPNYGMLLKEEAPAEDVDHQPDRR